MSNRPTLAIPAHDGPKKKDEGGCFETMEIWHPSTWKAFLVSLLPVTQKSTTSEAGLLVHVLDISLLPDFGIPRYNNHAHNTSVMLTANINIARLKEQNW
jgi:hypothetical protein